MQEEIEVSAKTVEEGVAKALRQLGLDRSQVEVEVLAVGRPGLLGLGGESARVIVRPLAEDRSPADSAAQMLMEVLSLMGVEARVTARPPQSPGESQMSCVLDIRGDDMAILIGRRGETLGSLQYLVNLIISRRFKRRVLIGVDVEGYRHRREENLQSLALRMAERVRATGQSVTLEPMPASERRIVHLALMEQSDVITQSIGEGDHRKVVIAPR
ncbi:MAG TPA: RNA-binding cell elongation regulator Jag/EloR [Dehalococcoidia bacterium]|nr:RNA-binding cell elongation regulator Jag/EloR [Dehalococcoidia bacterium]